MKELTPDQLQTVINVLASLQFKPGQSKEVQMIEEILDILTKKEEG